ncbi:MAG TPA: glycosyltransferase family 39 protein [Actinocrinis sp.]
MIERELTGRPNGASRVFAETRSEPDAADGVPAAASGQEPARPATDADAETTLMPAIKDDEPAPAPAAKTEPQKADPDTGTDAPAEAADESEPEPAPAPAPQQPTASGQPEQNAAESMGIWAKTMPARPRHRLPAPPRTGLESEPAERHGRHADFEARTKPPAPEPKLAEAEPAPADPEATATPKPEVESAPPTSTPTLTPTPEPKAEAEHEPRSAPPKPEVQSAPPAPDLTPTMQFTARFDTDLPSRPPAEPAPPAADPQPARPKPEPEPEPSPLPSSGESEERVARDFDFEHWMRPVPESGPGIKARAASGGAPAPGAEIRVPPQGDNGHSVRRDPKSPVGDQDETQVLPALKGLAGVWADPRLAALPDADATTTGAESDRGSGDGSEPGGTKTAPPPRAASSAPAEAPAAEKPARAAKDTKDSKDAKDAANWRQSIPYDETGVLIRPKGWSDDDIETALVEMGPLREALTAAQAEARLEELRAASAPGGHSSQAPAPRLLRRLGTALRPRPRHGVLAAIMVLQSTLTLRNTNSAFEDEGLYLFSGHLELAHLLDGAQIPDFTLYFSGSPVLYPVLGAVADQIGGLFAARLLNLLFMLGATGLLYLIARRLFGVRVALCSAAIYATTPSAVFVGGLATYDAPALFLLALSGWIVVRCADSRWPFYLLVAPLVVLASATKYAAFLFVPTVIVLAGISAMVYGRRGGAVVRSIALAVLVGACTYGALKLGGSDYMHGIAQTTTARASGGVPRLKVLVEAAQWGALPFFAAVIGALYYVFRPTRADDAAPLPGRLGRVLVSLLLVGTALLAPANQIRIETDVALQKHVGFGMLFAAPLAGYALVRLTGEHFRRLQIGIGVLALSLAIGLTQSNELFTSWPDQRPLVAVLRDHQKAGAAYLVEDDEPVEYYMRGDVDAEPTQFDNTYAFAFVDSQGQYVTGTNAYLTAIHQGYFQVIALDYTVTAGLDSTLVSALQTDSGYKLVATVQESAAERDGNGYAEYRVWAKI